MRMRLDERLAHDVHADHLVGIELELVERGQRVHERHAAAGDDALFDRRTGRLKRVLDAVLLLLELDLGGRADLDDGHAAGELGQALLELLLVEVGVGVLDLDLDLVDAGLDRLLGAGTVDDGRALLGDLDGLGATEHLERHGVELHAQLLGDDLATGDDGDVLEHALAAITEARRLDGHRREGAAQLVEDQRRERLALEVLGDDQQVLAGLHDLLEHGQQIGDVADLLVHDQDQRIGEHCLHAVRIGDHVRRDVALVELKALDGLDVDTEGLGLLDGDDAVLAHDLHGLGDLVADLVIGGRDGADVRDLVAVLDLLGGGLDLVDDRRRRPSRCRGGWPAGWRPRSRCAGPRSR